jgi:hypothetical protein
LDLDHDKLSILEMDVQLFYSDNEQVGKCLVKLTKSLFLIKLLAVDPLIPFTYYIPQTGQRGKKYSNFIMCNEIIRGAT